MHRYQILVAWSPEDRVFVAQVPDLPGCIAHGRSETEARDNARSAIDLYLEDLSAAGDSIPEPRQYHLLSA
jgi:predicted RNase H-like HicB family nuclease